MVSVMAEYVQWLQHLKHDQTIESVKIYRWQRTRNASSLLVSQAWIFHACATIFTLHGPTRCFSSFIFILCVIGVKIGGSCQGITNRPTDQIFQAYSDQFSIIRTDEVQPTYQDDSQDCDLRFVLDNSRLHAMQIRKKWIPVELLAKINNFTASYIGNIQAYVSL